MAESTNLDHATVFVALQQIVHDLYQTVAQELTVTPSPNQPFREFSSPDGQVTGSLQTFWGDEIDWLVRSWLHAPQMGFSDLRLTVWLGPQSWVPHFAVELGTMPTPFFYLDYIPRVDVWADLPYVERYYEPLSSTYSELRQRDDLSLFVSKSLYVRQLQSPAHLCFTCPQTEESLALIRTTAQAMCDRWLTWVKQADPVPADQQAALAARDLTMRRTIAERDPDNAAAAQMLGEEFTTRLVRSLWDKNV